MTHECVVFVVGEGSNDIGWLATEPQYRRPDGATGFVPPILEQVAKNYGLSLRFEGRKLSMLGKANPRNFATNADARKHGLAAHTRKAAAASALAKVAGADFIVYVADVDRAAGRSRSKKEGRKQMAELRSAIEVGLAQDEDPLAFLIGTPLRMIEAWALRDLAAVTSCAQSGATTQPPSKPPEELWGAKRNPASNYPKHALRRALGREAGTDDFTRIALEADLEQMRERCPASFAPFLDDAECYARRCASNRE